jgi:hypothetical protein
MNRTSNVIMNTLMNLSAYFERFFSAFLCQPIGFLALPGLLVLTSCNKAENTSSETSYTKESLNSFPQPNEEANERSYFPKTQDQIGVGYRVFHNKLESVVSKMVVEPSSDWLLLTGLELRKTHPHAEFGLKHAKEELYLVLVPEYIDELSVDVYTELNLYNLEKILGNLGTHTRSFKRIPATIADRTVDFTHYSLLRGEVPLQWFLGIFSEAGNAYQILGWGHGADIESIFKKIQSAGEFIEFMPTEKVAALQEILKKREGIQDDIGIDWCFRNDLYQDFEYHFTWKKPKAHWLVKGGKAAYAENEDSRMSCRELVSNLRMQVIPEKACCTGLDEFHKNVSTTLLGEFDGAIELNLDGHEALESNGLVKDDLFSNQFKIVSTIRNGNAYQIVFWGLPGIMEKNGPLIKEALAGFQFPKTLKTIEQSSSSFKDHRMGYSLKIKGEWDIIENVPAKVQDFGSGVSFKDSNQSVQIIAFNTQDFRQDVDRFLNHLIQSVHGEVFATDTLSKPESGEVQFAGMHWKEQLWTQAKNTVRVYTTRRGNTVYFVSIVEREGDAKSLLSEVCSSLQFLE